MVIGTEQNQSTSMGTSTEDAILESIHLQDQQLKTIEEEQKAFPLVGEKVPISTLVAMYDPKESPAFFSKANELAATYSHMRIIRGDGNCYLRAVQVGLFEILLKDRDRLTEFIWNCKEWKGRLTKLGFQYWAREICDNFVEFTLQVRSLMRTIEEVLVKMNDDETANYYIIFFRLISSGFLREHAAEYEPFITNGMNMVKYCESEVEAMWKESDHIGVIALVRALNIRLRIEYMDRNAAPNGGTEYNIPDGADNDTFVPDITLLYRPGHYDLIYKKSEETPLSSQ